MTSPSSERRAKALELRLAGATYDVIAQAVGYASRSGAQKAVQEQLDGLGRFGRADAVDTELARLDAMLTGLWPKARRGDVQAVDRVLKIGERRVALMLALTDATEAPKESGLSDFEKRLAERESTTKAPRRAKSS